MHALNRIAPNRCLRLFGLGAVILALLAIVAGDAGTASAAPPTPNVSASASGNRLFILTSVTTTPVNWEVSIGLAAPAGTPPRFGSAPVRTATSSGPAYGFSHSFFSMTPNTTYHYIVKATDAGGQSSYKIGSVKSKARDILVDYTKITVLNDGDGIFRGKGELTFDFALNRCWVDEWRTSRSLSDGNSFDPNAARYFSKYHQSTLDLAVYALEDDGNDLPGEFCPRPLRPFCEDLIVPGRGTNSCFDWAQAALTVYVTNAYHHMQNATEKVTFESPAWDGVRFRVEVTLGFTYYTG
jgi:hypothetical protein